MELSKEYLEWVSSTNQQNLTRNQAIFANWCFENKELTCMIGSYLDILYSIRQFVRKPKKKEDGI